MRIKLKNQKNVGLTLSFTDIQAKHIVKAKRPMTKAMDIVRKRLGDKHGFYPVALEGEVRNVN